MDSRVIQVVNTMITKSDLIKNVIPGSLSVSELFFVYNFKYRWSIMYKDTSPDDYILYYYHTDLTITDLAQTPANLLDFITYKASDFKSQEAYESFQDLYNVIKGKLFGMDDVLNDILR